jgi:hypothetical protein
VAHDLFRTGSRKGPGCCQQEGQELYWFLHSSNLVLLSRLVFWILFLPQRWAHCEYLYLLYGPSMVVNVSPRQAGRLG